MDMTMRTRARSGDPDAFGALFDEHARAVYNYAYRRTGSWPAAEEVVSLTFLEAWRLRDGVQPEGGSLRPWLLGIAVNVLRNQARAERRHRAALDRLPQLSATPDFADEVADRIDAAARLEAVRAAVEKLRRGEREVLTLCVWSGLGYAAAAEALGIPVGTVRSRLARVRKKLRHLASDPGLGPAGVQAAGEAAAAQEPGHGYGQLTGNRGAAAIPTPRSTS
jgi:RNA polymerase sigma-70 factor (ECF subfamily)